MLKEKLKNLWYRIAQIGCVIFCRLMIRLEISGLENVPKNGCFLLVSNHQSYLDPVLCGAVLNRQLYYVARDTLFVNKYFRMLMFSLNAIALRRGESDLAALKVIIEKLKSGAGVAIFAEGTRTRDGKIIDFQPGIGLLCKRGGAPILPVVLDGAFECWPRYKRMFSFGSKIVIRYGKSIAAKEARKMDRRKLAKYLADRLRQMQKQVRIEQGKEPFDYGGK